MDWFRKPITKLDDWRSRAEPEELREYDAFGPWIIEVRTEAEMPKHFRLGYDAHKNARYLIKVPIDVERREARPGMSLYRYVIAIHEEGATMMRLVNEQIVSSRVKWADVVALRRSTNLLLSRWSLLLSDGSDVTIDYNTVSSGIMDTISEFIRERCAWQIPTVTHPVSEKAVPIIDHLFKYHLSVAQRVGPQPVVAVHYEAKNQPCRNEAGKRRWTTGLMILEGQSELTIVADDPPERRAFQSHYGVSSTFIPYGRISSFSVMPASPMNPPQFQTLTMMLERQTIRQRCLNVSESIIEVFTARGIAQRT